ncbi:deoxyribose-phosphate aldolase [Peptoniphilus lacrimalis DNF00528]|uniref:Deoxyribose-phosphate aldolase n=1 Tax=Peptoniphilus lacrimalis 315-B TaxID=596330 RepID=D1VVU3_9FIRM|nr:deoxyribose-phosphate aldolase [Peptoniphilus lacrimalis]EFA89333.1 deoxyribose-phosphate aldolase [Peptoniphilus lacrimalis 315-B]KGF36596.1 deoxyribose-phosphate aldolase [Peptoniphilus lacrimalis DNF00528]
MKLNKYIDHTLLKADATQESIKELCRQAKEYDFMSVCINSSNIELAKEELKGTDVKICTVIGFPLGATTTESKVFETTDAIEKGADEVDMVLNIGALKSKNFDIVLRDISEVAKVAHNKGKILKVILETCLLEKDEIIKACQLSKEAGADFVKTSTGFSTGGAKEEDVALMRKTVGDQMGVKASGGIRTLEKARLMIENGATRLGVSAGVQIMEELESEN